MVKFNAMVRGTLDVVLMVVFALGLVALTGCGSSGNSGGGGGAPTPPGALAVGGAKSVYAIEATGGGAGASILGFSADTSGAVSPTSTLATGTTLDASAVATDSSGEIYVSGQSATTAKTEVLVFAAGATGTATPVRTINVDPDYGSAGSIAVDATGRIYLAGTYAGGTVEVLPAGAEGTVAPSTVLTSSTITEPLAIAVDSTGKLYVSNVGETGGQILVFAAGASGSDPPVQTISTAAATSTTASAFYGVAVDGSGNIFAVQDSGVFDSSGDETSASAEIEEFAAGATGVATPTKTITSVAAGFTYGGGLQVDNVGNAYVITATALGDAPTYSVLGFGPNSIGEVAPGVTITSTTLVDALSQIAVF